MSGSLPSKNQLRDVYVGAVDEKHEIALRTFVSGKYVIVFIDETPDNRGESMVDICVEVVDFAGKMGKTIVLDTCSLLHVNNETVTQELLDRLTEKGIRLSFFVALGMDNASYMKKAFNDRLSVVCPKLVGLFCLAHSLNLVAESLSGNSHFKLADQFFHDLNRYFSNSTQRKKDFLSFLMTSNEIDNPSLPPDLCDTRWRPWLLFVIYLSDGNLDHVFSYFSTVTVDESTAAYLLRIVSFLKPENNWSKAYLEAQLIELTNISMEFINMLDFSETTNVPVVHLALSRFDSFRTILKVHMFVIAY